VSLIGIAILAGCFIIFCFGFVLLFGAPFVPTLKSQIAVALDLLDLKPGQTMLELGCGDGRVLIAAAKRGCNAVGYELNPILVAIALLRTWRYRRLVVVHWGDYWRASWPVAEGIFGFILPRYMAKLNKKIVQYPYKPVKLASFAFTIPQRSPVKTEQGVFLYEYRGRS
jgi:SAM-dependent methyltransferase